MLRMKQIDEFIGWFGVVAILLAYGLNSIGMLTAQDIIYLLLNISGAGAIMYHSIRKKDNQPAILNLIWLLIALIALVRLLFF